MNRFLRVLALMFVCAWAVARAQSPPPCTTPTPQTTPSTFTCQSGADRTLLWDYSDTVIAGDVFRLYVNAAQVGADIPARTATGISVQFGATLTPGSYTVAVSLVRPGAVIPESVRVPVTLVLVAPPPNPLPPTNLRVVEVIIRGLDNAGLVLWEHTERMTAVVAP